MPSFYYMVPFGLIVVPSVLGLPAAIWFARDAYVARLNPWIWGLWGMLSVAAPTALIFGFGRLIQYWLVLPKLEAPWGGIIGLSFIAAGWTTAAIIHKHLLKPQRQVAIGTSLNYVGGWLGTLILWLVASGLAYLFLYVREAKKEIDYFCRDERTWQSVLDCIISFRLETLETAFAITCVTVTLTGCLLAAFMLCYRTPHAVRVTGYLLVLFCLFILVNPIVDQVESAATRDTRYSNPFSINVIPKDTRTQNVLPELIWLVYLGRSKRVREVFGRNFGE